MDLHNEATEELARQLGQAEEELLSRAVSKALGRTDWTYDELRGRLSMTETQGTRTVALDDKNLVELHLPGFEWSEDGLKLRTTFNYRMLI